MKVELVLSIVLASSTVIYTLINAFMLFESRATRRQKITPLVIAFLKVTDSHDVLGVYLKNIGEGLAKNVRIKLLNDYPQFKKQHLMLSDCAAFKNGVNSFPPEYELVYFIDTPSEIDYSNSDSFIKLEIEFEDIKGRRFNHEYTLPFNQVLKNYSNPPETYMGQIPYYLKEINKNLKIINTNQKDH